VTEDADGTTDKVTVLVNPGTGTATATIPAGGSAPVALSDLYTDVPGSLVVTKTIAGPAAGKQGAITIVPTCDGRALAPFTIPAGTPAGSISSQEYPAAAGASCSVTETVDGHTTTVAVAISGNGGQVTIPVAASVTAAITDNYTDVPGTLVVNKTITGDAAGAQGQVTIGVTCGATPLPDFVIAGGTAAGSESKTYSGIPAGAVCTITETADGHTSTVSVSASGGSQQVTIPAGGAVSANLTDNYSEVPGKLVVTKTITGPAADRRGQVVIVVTCDGVPQPQFVIAADASGSDFSRTYDGIPAGATCTAVETVDGHTDTVDVQSTGSNGSVDIPANATATLHLADRYSDVEGSLIVLKTISGSAAGDQGAIAIAVSCDKGTPKLDDFDIPAGAAAGSVSHTYAGLPAGATCVVDETTDGSTSTVHAVVTIEPRTATIPSGGSVTVQLGNAYAFVQPHLVLEKKVQTETPSGTPVNVTLTVTNVGKVSAAKVTVCLHLHQALVFAKLYGGHLVGNGACWRIVRVGPKAAQIFRPIVRSFIRRVALHACSRVTLESRGVDIRKSQLCTTVLAAIAKKPGGVTG
jgi:Domain of unknown function (DUF5979)